MIELPIENLNIPTITIDQNKLDIDIRHFINNDVIIIHSGTATGKTKDVSKKLSELKKIETYKDCKILSIVNLISLSEEQIKTFRDNSLDLKDYKDNINDFSDNNGVICINSLYKLQQISKYDLSNVILYIDEVEDLIKTITHGDTLNNVLNLVYLFLIKLIKNCKKIILSDATINSNTKNLISSRKDNNKIIYIKNINKKFANIQAIKNKSEIDFIKNLEKCIKNNEYFLFGCDSCERITSIFNDLVEKYPEKKESFILKTSKSAFKITDACTDFNDKFVFYSPSITTGVSFIKTDKTQTQFLYITSNPQIDIIACYQMSSRTRNMKNLTYFTETPKPREMRFKTLEECETHYRNLMSTSEKVLRLSKSINEDDETSIVNNSFFKMYCYYEYVKSIYFTDYIGHFEKILKNNGFELSTIGEEDKLKSLRAKRKLESDLCKLTKIDEYIQIKFVEFETEEQVEEYHKAGLTGDMKLIDTRSEILNLAEEDHIRKYDFLLLDDYKFKAFFNATQLFKTRKYIKKKIAEKQEDTNLLILQNSIFPKIELLYQIENFYKIQRFGIKYKGLILEENENKNGFKEIEMKFDELKDEYKPEEEINDDIKTLYKEYFSQRKSGKHKFNTKYEIIKSYVHMIKSIIHDISISFDIITEKKGTKRNDRTYKYYLDVNSLIRFITLCQLTNSKLRNYDTELIETLTKIKPLKDGPNISDEDTKVNNYLCNKNTKGVFCKNLIFS
jgi:hypothetical protein